MSDRKAYKLEWQRRQRAKFKAEHGYSTAADVRDGGKGVRLQVLIRDEYKCVACGMHDAAHRVKWNRPITVDHKDRNRKNNTLENLQTLCLSCHGRKDISPKLIVSVLEPHKSEILAMHNAGASYRSMADKFDVTVAAIWKNVKKWKKL